MRLIHVREHVNAHDLDQYVLDRCERYDDLDGKTHLWMFNKFYCFNIFFVFDNGELELVKKNICKPNENKYKTTIFVVVAELELFKDYSSVG